VEPRHAAFDGQARRPLHNGVIAGMCAAGDVGRGDALHLGRFVGGIFQFPHVAIQIYSHSTGLILTRRSSVLLRIRSLCRRASLSPSERLYDSRQPEQSDDSGN